MNFLSKLFDMLFGWMSPKIDLVASESNVKEVAEMIEKSSVAEEPAPVAEKAPKKARKPRAKKEKKSELRVEE